MLRRFERLAAGTLLSALASCSRGGGSAVAGDAGGPPPLPSASAVADSSASGPADPLPPVADVDASLGDLPTDAPFEGRIGASAGDPDPDADVRRKRQTYVFTVQGNRFRWDIFTSGTGRTSEGYRIYDGEKKKFFTVLNPTRQVFVFDEVGATADAGAPTPWKMTPVIAGRIAGHPCDIVSTSDATRDYEACVVHDLPPFPLHLLVGVASEAAPFNVALEAKGAFPLVASAFTKPPKGTPKLDPKVPHNIKGLTARFEVWELTRFRVNPAVFDIPAGYTQIKSTRLDLGRPSLR